MFGRVKLVLLHKNVNKLIKSQQQRVFFDCKSHSNEAFNTFTLRKALPVQLSGENFIMEKANFSSTPVHDKLSPTQIFNLTPAYIPENADVHEHLKEGYISVAVTKDAIHKLLGVQDFQILNPKYYQNNQLIIPRNVLKQII